MKIDHSFPLRFHIVFPYSMKITYIQVVKRRIRELVLRYYWMNNLIGLFLVPTLPKYNTRLCSIFLWKYLAYHMQYYAPYIRLSHQTRYYLSQPPSKKYHQLQPLSAKSDVCSQSTHIICRNVPFEVYQKLWFIQWYLRQDGYPQNHWLL